MDARATGLTTSHAHDRREQDDLRVSDDPAAVLGVDLRVKDPHTLSARLAQEALRSVAAQDEVPDGVALEAHADPKVPGANYVDGSSDARYWVGMAGEVLPTSTSQPHTHRNPEFTATHAHYAAAVDAVRLALRVPVCDELFAVPDTFVPGAFFVHDTEPVQTVRWVAPDGGVHDGYVVDGDAPRWDAATVTARHAVLAAQTGTAALVD